jgi:hypothetical protein
MRIVNRYLSTIEKKLTGGWCQGKIISHLKQGSAKSGLKIMCFLELIAKSGVQFTLARNIQI